MAKPDILWKPQPGPQTEFSARPEFEVLYGGAKGGGKSDVLLMEGLRQIENPNYHAGFFRRTYPRLQEMIDRSWQYFPKLGAKWKGQEHRWVFPSGARYDFRHIQIEDDKFNYQGQEFHYLAFDQLEEFTETMYDFMIMQIRTSDPTIRTYVRASANPGGIGHAWVKKRFIEGKQPYKRYVRKFPLLDGREIEIDSCFIPARVYDNKILLEANPQYLALLMSLPDDLRRAMLDGDWDVFAGQYFREFRREKHVVRPFAIPADWKRFRSIDWGYNDPCAVYWHAVDPEGRVYTYRELYIRETMPSDVAKEIVRLSASEDISYTVASPDMWAKRGTARGGMQGETIAETFILNGVPVTPADNDRSQGWQRIHEYLADAPDGLPSWQIFETCTELIRTLPALVYDEHKVEDVSDECEDHGPESCRYALMSRPSVKAKIGLAPDDWTPGEKPKPGTVNAIIETLKRESEEKEEFEFWTR